MYTWDDHKNKINQNKHSVSFETASLVFDDPLHITRMERIENGVESIRIISARRATRTERKNL